jgi:hypothetical protein
MNAPVSFSPHVGRITALTVFLLAIGVMAACKGSGTQSPTEPSAGTGDTNATNVALPYGQATGSDTGCPVGSPSDQTCTRLTVSCPSVPLATVVLRVGRPTGIPRGTIVLTSGGDGTSFIRNITPLGPAMLSTFLADGLVTVEVAWDSPGIWGGPRARTLACRAATVMKWTYDNVHAGARTRLFAAQGTSGGAAQIAFGLAHYGLSDLLDLANLGGGPPRCPLCSPDGQNPPEPLLPGAPPSSNREPRVSYPTTVTRFFLGAEEPTPDIVADANAFYNVITSTKSFTTVPGTAHDIEQTQAGVDAFVGAVRGALK